MAYTAPTFVNDSQPALNAENMNNLAQAVESLCVENGGTGASTLPQGGVLIGAGTQPVETIFGTGAVYATTNGNPTFGTLPASCGGTGYTSIASLRGNIKVYEIRTTEEGEPDDTNTLWINPDNNSISYYYDGSWRKIVGVFGV